MTSATVAPRVERRECEGARGRPAVETRDADDAPEGGTDRPATTDDGEPLRLGSPADREGAK